MCNTCCSHKQLGVSSDHVCSSDISQGPLYHAGLIQLQPHGVLFPGEHLVLDVYLASALRLLSEVQTTRLYQPNHCPESHWGWPNEECHLLTRAFAIAPAEYSHVGAIAVFEEDKSPVTEDFDFFTRFRAVVVGRYHLAGPAHVHNIYPCIPIRLLCDIEHIPLNIPLNKAFPCTAPLLKPRRHAIVTRSATSTKRNAERRRTSAYMGGLSYSQWHGLNPDVLVRRARAAATYARLDYDRFLLDNHPSDNDCPSRWSFWLCAGLPLETGITTRMDLLQHTSVIARLRQLIQILLSIPWKKRKMFGCAIDPTFRMRISSKRPRLATDTNPKDYFSHQATLAPKKRSQGRQLDFNMEKKPWPCSPANGFTLFNPNAPLKGKFQPLRPLSLNDIPKTKPEQDGNMLLPPQDLHIPG